MSQKVLIIDDNPGDQALISSFLLDAGLDYKIISAESGEEGIKKAREEFPTLVFLDTLMPGLNGYEVCESLKDLYIKHMHIIMMTGNSSAVNEEKAKTYGANGYCIKTPESIFKAVLHYHQYRIKVISDTRVVKVLLVEDNPGDKQLMKEALSDSGISHQLYDLERAEDIIDWVKKIQPDIVFMDIIMPGTSGGDAVRLLIENVRTKELPIVFLSGTLERNEKVNTVNVSNRIYDAVAKPINSKVVAGMIRKYIKI